MGRPGTYMGEMALGLMEPSGAIEWLCALAEELRGREDGRTVARLHRVALTLDALRRKYEDAERRAADLSEALARATDVEIELRRRAAGTGR